MGHVEEVVQEFNCCEITLSARAEVWSMKHFFYWRCLWSPNICLISGFKSARVQLALWNSLPLLRTLPPVSWRPPAVFGISFRRNPIFAWCNTQLKVGDPLFIKSKSVSPPWHSSNHINMFSNSYGLSGILLQLKINKEKERENMFSEPKLFWECLIKRL